MATIQDRGRFGYRQYGIPWSGAMDPIYMQLANQRVGNTEETPVIEMGLTGITLEALERTAVSVVGTTITSHESSCVILKKGEHLVVSRPVYNYAYLAIKGKLKASYDFGSYSTYARAGFGGIGGAALSDGMELITKEEETAIPKIKVAIPHYDETSTIRFIKGPEWGMLKELPDSKAFTIDSSSDRMGIRLSGAKLDADFKEMASSAVIPGTIQLPPDGRPIILMNDCQTTGGYPRIGHVLKEDVGLLAQITPGKSFLFELVEPVS